MSEVVISGEQVEWNAYVVAILFFRGDWFFLLLAEFNFTVATHRHPLKVFGLFTFQFFLIDLLGLKITKQDR
jgi:hypothetical protein